MTNSEELNDGNFDEVVRGHSLVMIDFWTTDCQPCKLTSPIVEELAVKYRGRILVGTVRADQNPKIVERFGIKGVPTLLLMRDGCEIERIFLQVADIVQLMKDYLDQKLKKWLKQN